jgi:hypothetical protein|nr:MAG TPA: hypothetical protein [Ackermannviridae sp.]
MMNKINNKTMNKEIEKFRNLTSCDLTEQDGKVYFGSSIRLINSDIETIPDNLTVDDDVVIARCTKLKKLPDNLTVRGC